MYAAKLLDRLSLDGITLRVEGGDIIPEYSSRDTLIVYLPEIRRHKKELIEILSGKGASNEPMQPEAAKPKAADAAALEAIYRAEIREAWPSLKEYLIEAYKEFDGLSDEEAADIAKETLTYEANQVIRFGIENKLGTIRYIYETVVRKLVRA